MNIEQAKKRAEKNLNDAFRHKYYAETCNIKKECLQVITGKDISNLIPQFELRESPELWKQRLILTIENLSSTTSPICDKFYGIKRITPNKIISSDSTAKLKLIKEVENDFFAGEDVDSYMNNVLDKVAMYDPNAFLTVSFDDYSGTGKPEVYPVVFGCEQVFDFEYNYKGFLDFLFVRVETTIPRTDPELKNEFCEDYYCLAGNAVIIYREIANTRNNVGDSVFASTNGHRYNVSIRYPFGTRDIKTPAKRLGYILMEGNSFICDTPLRPAMPILKDIIRDKSEYDISKRIHVFPKLAVYQERCEGETHKDPSRVCVNGYIAGTSEKCSVCGGDGFRVPRSAQEITKYKMPKHKDEFIPLSELSHYVTTDLETVRLLREDINNNIQACERAIFSSRTSNTANSSTSKEFKTATSAIITTDEYNFVLDGWAKNREKLFCFIIKQVAEVLDDTTINVSYSYNGKYVMESANAMIETLNLLSNAGVSEQIIDESEFKLSKVLFDNDTEALARYNTKRLFYPFRGRPKEEIATLLQDENVLLYTKVLYTNFIEIFQKLELKNGIDFYSKAPIAQKALIDEEVRLIIEDNKTNTPPTIIQGIRTTPQIA